MFSLNRWKDQIVVITGASSGIGAAIAEKLVEEGLKVVGLARRVELMEELAIKWSDKEGTLFPIKADVTKEEDILEAFKWIADNLGHVHILINNAGILRNGSLSDTETSVFREVLEVNVLGLCIATREALKVMQANNINGHIIHINSIGGHYVPSVPNVNIYPATKHAVTGLTESLRREINFVGSKIKITSLSPGVVTTEIFDVGNISMPEEVPAIKPEDVATAAVYILSTPENVLVNELIVRAVGELI